MVTVNDLVEKRFSRVYRDDEKIVFVCDEGEYVMEHLQVCCEHVFIESIVGDLSDLENTPILVAEEVTHEDVNPPGVPDMATGDDSFTWTFYKFVSIRGYVDVRWFGESNGYYSESVDITFKAKGGDHASGD